MYFAVSMCWSVRHSDTLGTKGRRKVEIKKVEAASNCHVTFSKRKKGLFNKATKLSLLTGAETAAIVVSGNGRMFGFGSASCDAVIHRYLAESDPHAAALKSDRLNKNIAVNSANLAKLRQHLLEARRQLEEEKKRATMIQQRKHETGGAVPAELW
ncbi:hypothetical protein ACLB2K_002013 [Fragaria x ananassa]